MIYITGDTHGDFGRIEKFCYDFQTTKDDYLIILGDAGINYWGESDKKLKQKLSELPITFLLVYGNHEERPENIKTYQEYPMFSGLIYKEEEYPNLIFLKDSEIYNINNQKVLVLGGAFTINKEQMINLGYPWFRDEQPNDLIKNRTLENLEKENYQVDIILTHTCPFKYLPYEMFHVGVNQKMVDQSLEHFLDKIECKTTYNKWYCGHFHTDKIIDRMVFMFEGIKEIK